MVFFDIDGTLLNKENEIPDSTKYAIYQLKRTGHQIGIATGRGPFMFEWVRKALGIETFISYNGQYVVHEGEVVYKNPIQREILEKLENHALEQNHPMGFMGVEAAVSNVDSHHYIETSFASLGMEAPPRDNEFYNQKEIYQGLLFCQEQDARLYDEFKKPFDFIRWHPYSMDIIPKGGSKANGIKKLIHHMKINQEDTIAFGDGLNDIEMLSYVNHGIAMGNGTAQTKDVADVVTKDVNEDGIYFGLKQLGII